MIEAVKESAMENVPKRVKTSFITIMIIGICILVPFLCLVDLMNEVTSPIHPQPTGRAFFDSTGVWDIDRIALIEPYDATSTGGGLWHITPIGGKATQFDVIDKKVIVAYLTGRFASLNGERVKEVWFVLLTEQGTKHNFTNEDDLFAFLDENGIDRPNLRDGDDIYEELIEQGTLEWYPNP